MKATIVLALAFLFAGCSESETREADALAAATCEGFCGEQAPAGCYCDANCGAEGDCCADVAQMCTFQHACDDEDSGGDSGGDDGTQACYPSGECFPVVAIDPYSYPSQTSNNYREPIAYIDVEAHDLSVKLSDNFKFSEFSAPHKGRYQVVQPHAVEKIQAVRNQAGALRVNSGFRSPTYNSSVGGATRSRHMYGDAFDVVPLNTSQTNLVNICNSLGAGYTAKYNSGHVHCDWRNDAVDPLFYGSLASSDAFEPYTLDDIVAEINASAGELSVEASGYDETEGDLLREWAAYDDSGRLLEESSELTFVPPEGATRISVIVGGLIEVEQTL